MSQTRNHPLEGRKREEQVGELQSMARHKRGLTNWRGGRGRSRLVSFKAWHITSEDSRAGGGEEGGEGWGAWRCGKKKMRTHQREGGREERGVRGVGGEAHEKGGVRKW